MHFSGQLPGFSIRSVFSFSAAGVLPSAQVAIVKILLNGHAANPFFGLLYISMKIKLIIFDLDGTLLNSSVDITNALNYAIGPYGLEELTVAKTISLVGEGVTSLIGKLVGQSDAERKKTVLNRFLDYYSRHLTDFTAPYPGVHVTLERVGHYRKAVISNKRTDLSRRLLENLGLADYFDPRT